MSESKLFLKRQKINKMEARMTKRLQKDLEAMQKNYKDQFKVTLPTNDLKLWYIDFSLPMETVYKGETYR